MEPLYLYKNFRPTKSQHIVNSYVEVMPFNEVNHYLCWCFSGVKNGQ